MEPVQHPVQNESLPAEHAAPRGNWVGREVQNISDVKKEAMLMSSVVYTLAVFILAVSAVMGVKDRNWSTCGITLGIAGLMGILGRMMHKAVLNTHTSDQMEIAKDQ